MKNCSDLGERWNYLKLTRILSSWRKWLGTVVSNMAGLFSIIWLGCHPSHWRSPSLFRGVGQHVGQPPTRWPWFFFTWEFMDFFHTIDVFFLQMAGHEVFPNNWLLVHRTWYNCKTWGFRMQKKLHITRRHDGCTSLFEAIEATVIWCYLLVDPSNYGYIPSGNFTGWWFGTWLLWLSIHIGNVIIPTDELIFFRGVGLNHQPV